MTKSIRIENADLSDYKVKVTVEAKQADGTWKMDREYNLDHPAQQASETLYVGKRVIIEEDGHTESHWVKK